VKKFETIEQILDFAIEREIEANQFYLKLADWVEKKEMRKVFTDFAEEELRHKQRLEKVKKGEFIMDFEEIGYLDIAETKEDIKPLRDMTYAEALIIAMRREMRAFRLYKTLALAAKKTELIDLFELLALQEEAHKLKFEVEYELVTF